MAGTVVSNLTNISLCEATTGWSGTPAPALNDPLLFDAKQGSYCLQSYASAAGNRSADYDLGAGGTDLSSRLIIFWFAFSKVPHATNYMRLRVTDTDGNWGEWNLFNKGSLPHIGWLSWAIHTSVAFDSTGGVNPTMSSIRYVGWRMDAVIAKVYVYWDAVRYGYGLDIKAGTSGSPATFEDFVTAETTYAYGIVEKYNGVYFIQGIIRMGDASGTDATYFKDTNQVIQFKSIKGNPTGFYEIKGQGNGTGTTEIYFGIKSGSAGISGCFIRAPSAMMWKLTMSDANITKFGFYGCTFVYADTIQGQVYNVNKEFLSSNFITCAEVIPDTGIVKSCIFISSTSSAIRMSSVSHNIIDCIFISCVRAIHIIVAGPFSYNNLDFLGNTYDGYNTSGVSVTVNYDQYCSPPPSTYDPAGNVITYSTSVTLTVRHVKSLNEPTEHVRCAIYKKSDMFVLMNKDADVADDQNPTYWKASEPCTVTGIVVIVRAREKGYLPFEIELTIPAGGLDVTAVWIPDPNYTP